MEKEYLIHNIEITDNPNDGHVTMDIALSDITLDGDITATVDIGLFVNGALDTAASNDDVSLTGSGGGGGVLPVEKCTITFQDIRVEGEHLTDTVIGCEIVFNIDLGDYYFGSASGTYTAEDGTYNDSKIELIIPTDHLNPTEILSMSFITENDGLYIWDKNFSPTISGDATYDADTDAVYVTGNCILSPDTYLD